MAKHRITQAAPHDSPWTLVFLKPEISGKLEGVTPSGGAKCKWGGLKSTIFNQYLNVYQK